MCRRNGIIRVTGSCLETIITTTTTTTTTLRLGILFFSGVQLHNNSRYNEVCECLMGQSVSTLLLDRRQDKHVFYDT